MSLLQSLWQALPQLSGYELVSLSGRCSKARWQGKGEGAVIPDAISASHCYIKERGVFILENGTELESHNEWLWQKLPDRVRLFHVRRGRDSPVELFELHEDVDSNTLRSISPHLCGEDVYEATVWLINTNVHIRWCISGKVKDEQLNYCYHR
ncbi:MAG: DUF6314 family protein [Endozoicomonas sp. (ex Botrylloides leachii)]|nr:DUF6314 family protein [Endozoicomonas sp. (ex Botrylloides leachii)]